MNPKEKKELVLSKLILILLAVLGLAIVVWLAWIRPSYSGTNTESSGQAAPSSATSPQPLPQNKTTQWLTIAEWDVRAPLAEETHDMTYVFTKADAEYVTFTFKRLEAAGICTPSAGIAMTRSTIENQPPHTIDNPAPVVKAGNYYYYLAYAGEPCTATATPTQKAIANQIHNGDLNAAIRSILQKLEAF